MVLISVAFPLTPVRSRGGTIATIVLGVVENTILLMVIVVIIITEHREALIHMGPATTVWECSCPTHIRLLLLLVLLWHVTQATVVPCGIETMCAHMLIHILVIISIGIGEVFFTIPVTSLR